jgi:anti-sigma regulatory factor (Ser/Thr protein kinase)
MEVAARAVEVRNPTDVAEARRRGAELAAALAFDEGTTARVALAITEAATNLLKHGEGGELVVGAAPGRSSGGLMMLALDRGRGMNDVGASLCDGYSTAGTTGTGLGAIRRAATAFDLYSERGRGTVLAATIYPARTEPLNVAAVSLAMPGEEECGDGWAVWSAGALTSLMVSDGLGHGTQAATATRQALAAFRQHGERSAHEVIAYVHDALRSTRGAAVAIAEMDNRTGTLRYCGLGNVAGVVVRPGGATQHLVSLSGIAGHVARRVQPFSCEWPPGSLLVMHSDGVSGRWSLGAHDGLASKSPGVIAGVLLREHRRSRDDATVAVARSVEAA